MKKFFLLSTIIIVFVAGMPQHNLITADPETVHAQTVPTRTPTSPPTKPPDDNNTQPTNTAVPPTITFTATPTPVPVTVGPTPIGGFSPTAESCSNMPTIQALNNTNVRLGPGTDYEIVGQLVFLEVRPIIGRAQNAEWWLITLADGTTGFVFNDVVNVSGYIDIVPIVPVPELDGTTPTPGPTWNPTPNPNCTVTPTPVPTNTPTPTMTATPEPTSTDTAVPETPSTDAATTALPTDTPTLVAQPTRVTTPTPLPTAVPLEEPVTDSDSNWLLFGAIGLVIVGVILFIFRRR